MIGLFYCIASIALGASILLYFPKFQRIEEKLTIGLILGFTLTTWITFLLSLIFRALNVKLILITSMVSLLISLFLYLNYRRFKYPLIMKPSKTYLISLVLFIILLSLVNLNTIKFDSQGNLRAMLTAWGDYAMHLSYISHFSEKTPLALNHPLIVNHKLTYPFLINFLSAIMCECGLDYAASIVLINILLSVGLVSIIYIFAREFTQSELAGLFVLILLFFNGNFGFLFALGKELREVILPTSFYTKIDSQGLIWGNTLSVLFLSQRALLWGMAIAVSIYLILLKELFSPQTIPVSKRNLFLAGILLGTLPLIHPSCFLTLAFVTLFFFIYCLKKEWLYFIIPSGVFALPQILYLVKNHPLSQSSFWFQAGWILKSANPFLILLFWIYNLGVIFFLIIGGIFLIKKNRLIFYLPFVLIFLIANFIMVHPSDWDNAKYFLHWFFISCVIAGSFLVHILNYNRRWKKPDRIFLVIILIFFSIFSGLIDYIYLNRVSFVMADKNAQGVAKWVRENIPASSLILTSDTHNHPVSMLSGRNIVMGYRGWLWSHGYDYRELEKDIEKIYRSADLELIKKYKITHILISPYEAQLKPKLRAFLKSDHFREIYKEIFGSQIFRIFEVMHE